MTKFLKSKPNEFLNAINQVKKHKEFLTIHDIKNYELMQLFLNEEKNSGYAITPDQEIVSLFNNSPIKGIGRIALNDAIKNNGNNLECFDGFLSNLYNQFGFKTKKRIKFNKKYAPKNWNYKNFGMPDVLTMHLTNTK